LTLIIKVPALFTENFDYQDIRRDFVRGVLQSDLLGLSIHYHILTDEYAARVRSTKMYDAISKDIIGRWVFPMVPDSNIQDGDSYQFHRGYVYKEANGVILARWVHISYVCHLINAHSGGQVRRIKVKSGGGPWNDRRREDSH
jgi:hypothetical protein